MLSFLLHLHRYNCFLHLWVRFPRPDECIMWKFLLLVCVGGCSGIIVLIVSDIHILELLLCG